MNNEVDGPRTGLFRGRPDPKVSTLNEQLVHRVKTTYLARLQTAKRLQVRTITWNSFLVVSSVVTTMAAVVLLKDPSAYGPESQVLMVVLGIGTLSASLLVTTANYGAKAEIFTRGYRDLQRMWATLEASPPNSIKEFRVQENRYQQMLSELPNHSEADFLVSQAARRARDEATSGRKTDRNSRSRGHKIQNFLNKLRISVSYGFSYLPIALALVLCLLLIPTVGWFFSE